MGHVYIFDKNADDFSTTGLCGALTPTVCEHEEIAGGMSAVTMEHPFDELGRWKHLQRGNVIKAPCRVRTTPEIKGGQVVTAVERWAVKATATQAQRGVYSKATKGRRKATAKPGTEVIVVAKGAERYKIKWGKAAGWIAHAALDFVLAETLPESSDAIEQVAPPWEVRPQLFRVQSVDADTDAGNITVYATHISYDLSYNLTRYKNDEPLTAQDALDGIFGSCDFLREVEAFTDIADTRTSCDWSNISPVEALLDPESGFCARWGAELVRDDFEMYFLRRAGRDRGVRLVYGKNLLGVTCETSDEQVATAILPIGEKKDGSPLYLTDYPDNYDNYVMSSHASEYPFARAYVLKCDDCTVEKGKKGVTVAVARARMLEQAQRLFYEDEIDLPSVNMTVNFLALGDTIEYAQYKDLEPVYLYDTVPVIDKRHGIEVSTDVHRVLWDCLLERMIEIELGNVRAGENIYSWQIPSLDGKKLNGGSVPGSAIEDGGIPPEKFDPDFNADLERARTRIAEAQERIETTREWLSTVEGALRDTQGNVSYLEQTAAEIRAALTDAEQNLLDLSVQANKLQLDMTDAEGNINTLNSRANGFDITLGNHAGQISSISATANRIAAQVEGPSGLAAQVAVLADRVAVKLKDDAVSSNYELNIRSAPEYSKWTNPTKTTYGLEMRYNGQYYGGLFIDGADSGMSAWNQLLISPGMQRIMSKGGAELSSYDMNHPEAGLMYLILDEDRAVGKRVVLSEAATTYSDERLKNDVAEIDHGEEIFDGLLPCQYRMIGAEALSYGFIAQNIKAVLAALGIPETVLLSDIIKDGDYMALAYQELHALTVHKVKCMEARHRAEMDALRAEIAAMKGGPS